VARYLFRRVVSWGRSSNVFLENGARLYLDVGSHPEYATPECDSIADLVVHDNALKHALSRLGGMKLVFSNAPRHYVAGVLRAMGLARYFDAVYSIEDARYRGKPALHGFRMLLRKHNLDPHRCAFVDDVLENLRTAHRLGMSTVWVSKAKRRVPYVELRVSSVLELPRLVFRYG